GCSPPGPMGGGPLRGGDRMLTIYGKKQRYCDGLSRRRFLQIGGHPFGGIAMPPQAGDLRPDAPPAPQQSPRAVLHLHLARRPAPAKERRWSDPDDPGFLGPAYAPFRPFVAGAEPYDHARKIDSSTLGPGLDIIRLRGITPERLQDRRRLLAKLDGLRKQFDS